MALRANQADQALVMYEAAQEFVAAQAMVNAGDNLTFGIPDKPWSGAPGKEPLVLPDGLATGGAITPGDSGKVNLATATAFVGGILRTVTGISGGSGLALTYTAGGHLTHSITIYDNGGTWSFKATAGATGASHSVTRGGDGGPPLILADEVEIGWVRTVGDSASVVEPQDILQIVGATMERYDYPIWTEDFGAGEITFTAALPDSHTGPAPKKVFAQVYTPIFAPLEPASDFVPPETTHTQSSTAVYGGAIGSASSSLGQGSFKVFLQDGVTDPFLGYKNQKMWVKFLPHRLRTAHLLAQGILGISRTFPSGDSIQADCTLTADGPAIEMAE